MTFESEVGTFQSCSNRKVASSAIRKPFGCTYATCQIALPSKRHSPLVMIRLIAGVTFAMVRACKDLYLARSRVIDVPTTKLAHRPSSIVPIGAKGVCQRPFRGQTRELKVRQMELSCQRLSGARLVQTSLFSEWI